jgi:hypothetical protein
MNGGTINHKNDLWKSLCWIPSGTKTAPIMIVNAIHNVSKEVGKKVAQLLSHSLVRSPEKLKLRVALLLEMDVPNRIITE